MCGVRACENMQKRVSHGEIVRVGSSVIIMRGNYGGIFCPPLSDIRGKIIFLRGSFALCPRVFPTLKEMEVCMSLIPGSSWLFLCHLLTPHDAPGQWKLRQTVCLQRRIVSLASLAPAPPLKLSTHTYKHTRDLSLSQVWNAWHEVFMFFHVLH